MADHNKTQQRTTPDERYLLSLEQGITNNETEVADNNDDHELIVHTPKIARQIKYRLRREISMSRDNPPRLPCRPWFDNGNEDLWLRPGEAMKEYHQERVKYYEIDYPANNHQNCYTCVGHRRCDNHLSMARRLTCFFCESEEGPL